MLFLQHPSHLFALPYSWLFLSDLLQSLLSSSFSLPQAPEHSIFRHVPGMSKDSSTWLCSLLHVFPYFSLEILNVSMSYLLGEDISVHFAE